MPPMTNRLSPMEPVALATKLKLTLTALFVASWSLFAAPVIAGDKGEARESSPERTFVTESTRNEAPTSPIHANSENREEIENLQRQMAAVRGRMENLTNEFSYAMTDTTGISSRERQAMEAEFQMEMGRFQQELLQLDAQTNRLLAEDAVRATNPVTAPAIAGGDRNVVRMVTSDEDGGPRTRLCVFVPESDGEAGVLSCSGQEDVRVIEWGPDHGRTVMFGDDAIEEDDLREMIEARIEAVAERLEQAGDLRIEYAEGVEGLHEEMEDRRENMRERQQDMREAERERRQDARERRREYAREHGSDHSDRDNDSNHDWEFVFSDEERANFEQEMEEFAREMEEFESEMASLQGNVILDLVSSLGDVGDEIGEAFGGSFGQEMSEFGAEMAELAGELARVASENAELRRMSQIHLANGQPTIRLKGMGDGQFTIVETVEEIDGEVRVVIHTTNPGSIEIVEVEPVTPMEWHERED